MTLTREEIQLALEKAFHALVWEREEYGDRIVSLDFAYTSALEKIAPILGIDVPPFE